MIFTKKINLKLAIIGITFMGLLIITNSVLMEFGLQKSVEFTYSTHYEETEKISCTDALYSYDIYDVWYSIIGSQWSAEIF